MNANELYETVVRIINTSFIDNPNTKIFQNYRIENDSGQKREIDVLIDTKVNEVDIKIAIECKNYKRRVSAEAIEAFKGKCDRIPKINKKVFISKNGFQKDAINAANKFGIDLFQLKEISEVEVKSWLNTITPRPIQIQRNCEGFFIDFADNEPTQILVTDIIVSEENKNRIQLSQFAQDTLQKNLPKTPFVFAIEGNELTEHKFFIPIETPDTYLYANNEYYKINKIVYQIKFIYTPETEGVSVNHSYIQHSNSETKAHSITFSDKNKNIVSIVKKENEGSLQLFMGKKGSVSEQTQDELIHIGNIKIEKE